MLKIMHGAKIAQDENGDVYIIDVAGGIVKLTDAPKVVSIAVTTAPTKVTYTAGEEFAPAGMVVTATYEGGTTGTLTSTDYIYTPLHELATTDTAIAITYRGKTTTQAITVNE